MIEPAANTIRPTDSNTNPLKVFVCTVAKVVFAVADHPPWLTELNTSEIAHMPTANAIAAATTRKTCPATPFLDILVPV